MLTYFLQKALICLPNSAMSILGHIYNLKSFFCRKSQHNPIKRSVLNNIDQSWLSTKFIIYHKFPCISKKKNGTQNITVAVIRGSRHMTKNMQINNSGTQFTIRHPPKKNPSHFCIIR